MAELHKDNYKLIGQIFETKTGECRVVSMINRKNIKVKFKGGFTTTTTLQMLKAGTVKNPYVPSVYGFGFIGEGKYKSKEAGDITSYYESWRGCIRRAYDTSLTRKFPAYTDCTVNPKWANFQNFGKWTDETTYELGWKLDKDLLVSGNREYGPETCVYLPNELNCIIKVGEEGARDLPPGVSRSMNPKATRKIYVASLQRVGNPNPNLGYFEDPLEAFNVYRNTKELYIRQRAVVWKDRISEKAFNALMAWKVLQ